MWEWCFTNRAVDPWKPSGPLDPWTLAPLILMVCDATQVAFYKSLGLAHLKSSS